MNSGSPTKISRNKEKRARIKRRKVRNKFPTRLKKIPSQFRRKIKIKARSKGLKLSNWNLKTLKTPLVLKRRMKIIPLLYAVVLKQKKKDDNSIPPEVLAEIEKKRAEMDAEREA